MNKLAAQFFTLPSETKEIYYTAHEEIDDHGWIFLEKQRLVLEHTCVGFNLNRLRNSNISASLPRPTFRFLSFQKQKSCQEDNRTVHILEDRNIPILLLKCFTVVCFASLKCMCYDTKSRCRLLEERRRKLTESYDVIPRYYNRVSPH